jgi:hypothetical protein
MSGVLIWLAMVAAALVVAQRLSARRPACTAPRDGPCARRPSKALH